MSQSAGPSCDMATERASPFPNPTLRSRLVLYPLAGGGVALDWHLDPILIQQARAAFAEQRAIAKLYLRRAGVAGPYLAEAVLDGLDGQPAGQALFRQPVQGALQAELGLEGQAGGGWLLLARSNQLQAVPELALRPEQAAAQVRASGRLPAAPELASGPVPEPMLESASKPAPESAPELGPEPAAADRRLLARAAEAPAAVARGAQQKTAEQRDWCKSPPPPTRFPDPSLAMLAERPEPGGGPFPLPQASVGVERAKQAKDAAEGAADAPGRSDAAPGLPGVFMLASAVETRADGSVVPVPGPSGVAEGLTAGSSVGVYPSPGRLDQAPPNRQDGAASGAGAGRGSGPIAPYPSAAEAQLQGELRVFGRAAPGSLLDLGGHSFRVGSGGRFSFRVALDDPELLAALLARLPQLPVAERDH